MRKEREIKIRVNRENIKEVEGRLKSIGAKFLGEYKESDIYYNNCQRNFGQTDEAVRLRIRSDGLLELTYKGPREKSGMKVREEVNVNLSSVEIESLKYIFNKLGLKEFHVVNKVRRYYIVKEFTICIDEVEGLGNFIEIESNDSNSPDEVVDNKIKDLIRDLNIEGEVENRSYLELIINK
jgi:adenylyl cyclase CyaB, putative